MQKPWYKVLLAARRLCTEKEPKKPTNALFTASDLSSAAKIKPGEKATSEKIASGWLGKFVRWGYALRVGSEPSKGRPFTVYRLTKWAFKVRKPKEAEDEKQGSEAEA